MITMKVEIRHTLSILSGLICAVISAALYSCTDTAAPGPQDVVMRLPVSTFAGAQPFATDSVVVSENFIPYTVTKFRFYISQPALLDSAGNQIPVQLADTNGKPFKYGSWLVDYQLPWSQTLRFSAKPGAYTGLAFSIGVPESANHLDASQLDYPMNVDADMYWIWSSGYIFLKIEGRSYVDNRWLTYIFHVGFDRNYKRRVIKAPITVSAANANAYGLRADVNRLFVTPVGSDMPNLADTTLAGRNMNEGPLSTQVATNAVESGFINLRP